MSPELAGGCFNHLATREAPEIESLKSVAYVRYKPVQGEWKLSLRSLRNVFRPSLSFLKSSLLLCRWMEACLGEDLPPTTELEEGLRNGVDLAKLGNFFSPKVVSLKKIYDREQTRYKVSPSLRGASVSIKQREKFILYPMKELLRNKWKCLCSNKIKCLAEWRKFSAKSRYSSKRT